MEGQTLHYYLKVFSIILITFAIIFTFYIFNLFSKNIILNKDHININKGDNINDILNKNIINISKLEIILIKIYFKINNILDKKYLHYGDFKIPSESSLIDLINIISKPSNMFIKITIVEGWSKNKLDLELSKYFSDFHSIPYQSIVADTYYIQKNSNFDAFLRKLNVTKINYFNKNKNNKLLEKFTIDELFVIGSLLEKEGLDEEDKKQISSVIINRLEKKMKLQIDATVIFAITNGKYNLDRKLLRNDLKIDHPFNTYIYYGLPPEPISYVGKKTLDLLLENNKNDFLFYFFNYSLNKHIFSKNFKEHKEKLNEYRKK